MIIKNITDSTLSILLPGQNYEVPAGWSLSAEDVWGGEETLRYIAVKWAGKVKVVDKEGSEIKEVECPGCGTKVLTGQKEKDAENI